MALLQIDKERKNHRQNQDAREDHDDDLVAAHLALVITGGGFLPSLVVLTVHLSFFLVTWPKNSPGFA